VRGCERSEHATTQPLTTCPSRLTLTFSVYEELLFSLPGFHHGLFLSFSTMLLMSLMFGVRPGLLACNDGRARARRVGTHLTCPQPTNTHTRSCT
jgi:hypothetical protein